MADARAGQMSPDGLWRWDGTAWRSAAGVDPAPLPAWARLGLGAQATLPALAGAVLVGLLADQALRTGTFGIGAAVTVAVAALVLVFAGRGGAESRVLAAGAAVFGAWLAVRASPWLLWPDLAAALILLGLSASIAVRGSLLDMGIAEAAARATHAVLHGLAGIAFIVRPLARARLRWAVAAPVARGALIAAPIAVLIGLLLAAADPVFASFFNLNIDFGQLSLDVLFVLAGALVAAGLLRLAAAEPVGRVDGPRWRLGVIEGLVVLAVLDVIFAAFAIAQAIAATGAAGDTLRAAGVTYADYARSGFFQLLWVAGITALVIIVFSRLTLLSGTRGRQAFVLLAEIAIGLTLLIVVVAFQRLSLYEQAFGFTMLRLYSHVFACWIALVFLFLAGDILSLFKRRRWFVGLTLASAASVLLALNIASPEAVVVALNIDHAKTAHKIDADYLGQLSNDAIPAILASRSQVDPGLRRQIATSACSGPRSYSLAPAAYNWADADAAAARRDGC